MSIRVRYFANLRELTGRDEEEFPADEVNNVGDILDKISSKHELPDNILQAVNMDYAEPETPVKEGDEVAFFPPVTGGCR